MSDLTLVGDLTIRGTLVAQDMVMPAGVVTSAAVQTAANIDADKLQHRHVVNYGQSGSATSVTMPVFVATNTCLINSIKAGSIAIAIGDSTVTVDLKKNGSTILSAVITLDTGNTARIMESGTLTGAGDDLIAGDFLELVVVATVGTGTLPTGLFVQIEIDEDGD